MSSSSVHIVRSLREIAWLLSLKKEDFFRSRAYRKAADALAKYDGDIDAVIDAGQIADLDGVGTKTAKIVGELHQTGRSHVLSELRKKFPREVSALARIPGLGLARLQTLHQALGIESVQDLRRAVTTGDLAEVKGFGPTTVGKIKAALDAYEETPNRLLLPHARAMAARLVEQWAPRLDTELTMTGALRRRCEAIETIELLGAGSRLHLPELPIAGGFSPVASPNGPLDVPGLCGWQAPLPEGIAVRLWLAPPPVLGAAQVVTTGPLAFAERALANGTDLTTEDNLLASASMSGWAPEVRDLFEPGLEAPKLVQRADIRGLVHAHTTYSDGRDDLRTLARAAKDLGYEYLTITDHSPSAYYAHGVSLADLKKQSEAIRAIEADEGIRILRGTESDIQPHGGLDHPVEVLEQLDIVIASIHGQFRLDAEAMTERLLKTFDTPVRLIWGHPLGRLVLSRPPIEADLPRILDCMAERGHILEVNGDPHRMDLPPRWIREARQRGIPFVLSADAHSVRGLQMTDTAVDCGRAGGLVPGDVLNTRGADEFMAAVRPTG